MKILFMIISIFLLTACKDKYFEVSDSDIPSSLRTITLEREGIKVDSNFRLPVNFNAKLKVQAENTRGEKYNIPEGYSWALSNPEVLQITKNGNEIQLIAKKIGETDLSISYNGITSLPIRINVTSALQIISENLIILDNQTSQIGAYVTFSDLSEHDVLSLVTWEIEDDEILEISSKGIITPLKIGDTLVKSFLDGVESNSLEFSVIPISQELIINKKNISVMLGETETITVEAKYEDGSSNNVTNEIEWVFDREGIVSIDSSGTITPIQDGHVNVQGRLGDILTQNVTSISVIKSDASYSVKMTPRYKEIEKGSEFKLETTVTFIDNSKHYITSFATYTSSNEDVASIDSNGVVTAKSEGHTEIIANVDDVLSLPTYIDVIEVKRDPEIAQKGSIFFNTNPVKQDLSGELSGGVLFAQSHIIPASDNDQEKRMHLVGNRKTKVMFKPEIKYHYNSIIVVTARDKEGQVLGNISMKNPNELANTPHYMPELNVIEADFSYDESSAYYITHPTSEAISAALEEHDTAIMHIRDGSWQSSFNLEHNNPLLDGKTFVFISDATFASELFYGEGRSYISKTGTTTVFKNTNGIWFLEDDLIFSKMWYAAGYWSAELPKEWISSGFSLEFSNSNDSKKGILSDIRVGAPTELLIHTIDIGMLAEPRDKFYFQKDKEAQREYFESAPISKLIVSEYNPVHLTEVMLPDGTLLTDHDPSEGSWHTGTMRQNIGKELISIGINNANYGIHSTSGVGEGENPYVAAQLTAHNSQGMYVNGLIVHGGSGGAGIVTLDASIGNEFSHEVGHNYGLGHYPGGFDGSIHRPANMPNSTWGWDSNKDVFIPNFSPTNTGGETCLDDQCVPAFNGMFKFGADAMAGGWSMYGAQRFTLYTPYSMSFIQKNLESKIVFDKSSSTGFKKWDDQSQAMMEHTHKVEYVDLTSVNAFNANSNYISQLFNTFDKVKLSTSNINWIKDVTVPLASNSNEGNIFIFNSNAEWDSYLHINDEIILVANKDNLAFVSDGTSWIQDNQLSANVISPKKFGVPVTTLVGYYDPQDELDSYIYPALNGSWGYVYPDDSETLNQERCRLEIENMSGEVMKYSLESRRKNADYMNKFHVNVATSDNPSKASIVCDGKLLNSRSIAAPKLEPNYTIHAGETNVSLFWARQERIGAFPFITEACNNPDHNH
tara:strand:- start:177 stop:3719 length:3543 start_codon:yes stop_codon:yes gene_type:complete